MLNPYVCDIDGDISRADAVVLTLLSRGKDVIEFGIGGSTIILSQVANKVITYEHDQTWIDKTKPKLNDKVEIRLIEKDPEKIAGLAEPCDVIFIDGHSLLRAPVLLEFWPYVKETVIMHDARLNYPSNCLKKFMDAFIVKNEPTQFNPGLPDNPYLGSLKSIHYNYLESNMVVMKKRNCTLKYENWKESEKVKYEKS